ncbi:hypothetical protein [Enterococcus xiangfangensis]|uniref:Uncharacterized protein n=1 Tax=Enterococcus xiangfangensis TaxID=1296537 RepID=A0ABU3FA79_9ENTE|nr:hypothetical protein [Enterococcus xiangfangensis]MBM7712989.1 hypothetical protein [Enterococcus xiangfangensis]MDT2759585.1 hypothetical protein [Enterococcus xiangfangensis]
MKVKQVISNFGTEEGIQVQRLENELVNKNLMRDSNLKVLNRKSFDCSRGKHYV